MLSKNLQDEIVTSFKDVQLDGGVGYFQSIAMDNLDSNDVFKIAIKKDKTFADDWMKLKEYIHLNEVDWFPYAHLDFKGIRFLLPTLLCLELKFTSNRLLHKLLTKSVLWQGQNNFWEDYLDATQKATIISVYEFWHAENLANLTSFGMLESDALTEIRNNKTLNMEDDCKDVLETLELLKAKQKPQ